MDCEENYLKTRLECMALSQQLPQRVISFSDVIQGRDANVRITDDGLLYAVDLVMVMTGKDMKIANQDIRRCIENDTFASDKLSERSLPGRGNGRTKLLTFQNAIELVMVLPGQLAKETRTQFANIIRRYMAGDLSLISEIQANAESASPIAQMARESLGIATEEDLRRKRRKQDQELDQQRANTIQMHQHNLIQFMDTMERLDPDWKKDTRLVMQTKDHLKNITLGQQAITWSNEDNNPIYISEVAKQLGYSKLSHGDSCKVGKKAAELYRAQHEKAPQQRKQFVDGAERLVAAYTEADRDIVERAIRAVL